MRRATDSELHLPVQALTRCLLFAGCSIRFGAAPRSTQDRAVLSDSTSSQPAR